MVKERAGVVVADDRKGGEWLAGTASGPEADTLKGVEVCLGEAQYRLALEEHLKMDNVEFSVKE